MFTAIPLTLIVAVAAFYFRHCLKAVADVTESAILDTTDGLQEQVSGYAVQMARDAVIDSQDAIRELQALDADPNVTRPSEYMAQRRKARKNRK